jgi:hypothetical protein
MSSNEFCSNTYNKILILQNEQITTCNITILNHDKERINKIITESQENYKIKAEQIDKKINYCLQVNYELWFQKSQYSIFCQK